MEHSKLEARIYVNGRLVHTIFGYADDTPLQLGQRAIDSIQVVVQKKETAEVMVERTWDHD